MYELVLCSGNPGKILELQALLPTGMRVRSLAELGLPLDLPETGATLEANAEQKARFAFERCGLPCLADDTGLEVTALKGEPGVLSARFAGPAKDPVANMALLLERLKGVTDRSARFRTVLALVDAEGLRTFEGEVRGTITEAPRGTGGFGYDPVFLPEMSDLTFAELPVAKKNAISHRGQAMWRFAMWSHEHQRAR
jgi:XTP/dITP diphosphohydrolase